MKGQRFLMLVLSLGFLFWLVSSPAFAQVTNAPIAGAESGAYALVISESIQQHIPNAPFFPLPVPLIQGGRVGDITDQLPNFAGMKKLRMPYIKENGERKEVDPGETVNPEKIASFDGCWFNRICLQDIWIDLAKDWQKMVEKGWDCSKMRYRIYYKDKAKGMGINLGGSGGGSVNNGGTGVQGSGGGIFGYSSSTADPVYIVMICEVME